jgi:uncharacterized protein YfaP (DUF2135 family)
MVQEPFVPPYFSASSASQGDPTSRATQPLAELMAPIGRRNALLMNQVSSDERFDHVDRITSGLRNTLLSNNFEVTQRDNGEIDLRFLDGGLSDYGLVFITTHGSYDGTRHWFFTGEWGNLLELLTIRYFDWRHHRVMIGKTVEERGGRRLLMSYFKVSDRFIDHYYGADAFPNSLVYFNACQLFKANNQMGVVFGSKGAQVTLGWTERQCKGHFTGQMLLDAMLGGLNLGEAVGSLPEEATVDYCTVPEGARLTFYPASGASTELIAGVVASAGLQINSPVDGASYGTRVVLLSGRLVDATSIEYGIVELNGQTTRLEFAGLEFTQPLVLNSDANTLRVNVIGTLSDGSQVFASTGDMTVIGDFAVLDLWTELRWNTDDSDVDFHLLPPGATLADLWTGTDCYFGNSTTTWGCELDVDDVDGYGPEHITMESASLDGTYRLFVHFWNDHGAGDTDAFVSIAVRDDAVLNLGPYELVNDGFVQAGDIWEVATIEYPSGTVTEVSSKITLGSVAASASVTVNK